MCGYDVSRCVITSCCSQTQTNPTSCWSGHLPSCALQIIFLRSYVIAGANLQPVAAIRSLGVTMDSHLTFVAYVTAACKACNYHYGPYDIYAICLHLTSPTHQLAASCKHALTIAMQSCMVHQRRRKTRLQRLFFVFWPLFVFWLCTVSENKY